MGWPGQEREGWRGWSLKPETRSFDTELVERLLVVAMEKAQHAYARYSGFRVGAALVMYDDPQAQVFSGVNVESATYGATICAERSAIAQAVGSGFRHLGILAVATPDAKHESPSYRSPCGICLCEH